MRTAIVVVSVLLLLVQAVLSAPFFKVFCSGRPLYRGRVDPIVSPGAVSGHVHKIAGGSNFGAALASQTPLQVYNEMLASDCTTCSIRQVDNSAYWHPDLFYRWPNGTYSLVPNGGLTVYYLFRSGSGAQANPSWRAFPKGFRMLSGNPFRRNYNSSKVEDRAISFACLGNSPGPETPGFPTASRFCNNGLRLQVHFPQCWDGVNLDSPSHTTHVAFPTDPNGGNCPSTHPVRLPDIFFEAFYSVDKFPHGTGTQPFVLASGDSTGYGFHGDFLNGWDEAVLQSAINHPSCDASSTNNGNNVRACVPLSQYVQETPAGACILKKDIPLNEYLGFSAGPTLPGCNPVTGGPTNAVPCSGTPAATHKPSATQRFHLKSVQTGKFVRTPQLSTQYLTADSTKTTYWETYTAVPADNGNVALLNEATMQYLCPDGPNGGAVAANRGSISGWEQYKIIAQANNRVTILSNKNDKYLSVLSDNTLAPTFTKTGTPTNKELFELVIPSGGNV